MRELTLIKEGKRWVVCEPDRYGRLVPIGTQSTVPRIGTVSKKTGEEVKVTYPHPRMDDWYIVCVE